jgi:hypothetical protein
LFLDPQFYRDEVVGTRVAPPIEYLVGAARRLEIDVPGQMVLNAGEVLGQRLFWPPSVKGWEGGMAWITTATMMNRSNMTGVMLETINVQTLILDEDPSGLTEMAALDPREDKEDKPDASGPLSEKRLRKRSRTNGLNQLADMQNFGWHPALSLTDLARSSGAKSDAEIVAWMLDELLAIPVQMDSNGGPLSFLKAERERAGLSEGALLSDAAKAEPILRDLAHLIFSTPEAQLN